jgi:membrane protein DedA with SNARE-associated domain
MIQEFSIALTALFFSVSPTIRIVLVFLSSYAEGLPIIGSILPGGTIALLVGSLSSSGFISPLIAISIIAMGSFLGDVTGFIIGKKFKHLKWLKNLAEHEKHQKKWDLFDRHLAVIIIFGKLIPLIRSTPSFFAGIRNIKTKKYLL